MPEKIKPDDKYSFIANVFFIATVNSSLLIPFFRDQSCALSSRVLAMPLFLYSFFYSKNNRTRCLFLLNIPLDITMNPTIFLLSSHINICLSLPNPFIISVCSSTLVFLSSGSSNINSDVLSKSLKKTMRFFASFTLTSLKTKISFSIASTILMRLAYTVYYCIQKSIRFRMMSG